VASLSSINALQASVAQAERQVQKDQVRVNQDADRLEASRAQLVKDKQTLSDNQRESNQAQAKQAADNPATTVNLNSAIENPPRAAQQLPADLTPPKPSVNTLGQTIGKFINVTA
jgi:formate-dependent nitrite reductase cytochrome c552 subunit